MTTENRKPGDKFVVVKEHSNFKLGEIVTLKFLDNDNCHAYTQNDGQDYWFAFDDKLEPYLEEPSYSKDIYISEEVEQTANCIVNAPNHYTQGDIDCIDAIKAALTPEEYRGFLRGNMMKYNWRLGLKGKATIDAEKCKWYNDKLIQSLKEKE